MKKIFKQRGIESDPLFAHSHERVMPGRDYAASIRDFWRVCSGVNEGWSCPRQTGHPSNLFATLHCFLFEFFSKHASWNLFPMGHLSLHRTSTRVSIKCIILQKIKGYKFILKVLEGITFVDENCRKRKNRWHREWKIGYVKKPSPTFDNISDEASHYGRHEDCQVFETLGR